MSGQSHYVSIPAAAVRMCAAVEAGKVAARFRLEDLTPTGSGNPDEHGAYQWANATGFYDDQRERSMFTMGFMDELARAGIVSEDWLR